MNDRGVLYLIDSSIWIPVLRSARVRTPLQDRTREMVRDRVAATTGMVRLELLRGASDEQRLVELWTMLDSLHQLPTDEADWTEAARIGQRLRRAGRSVPSTDLLIAAVAIRHSAVVFHRDADYDVIAQHAALQTETPE